MREIQEVLRDTNRIRKRERKIYCKELTCVIMDLASPKTFRVSQQAGHSERANVSVQILRQEKSHSLGRQLRRMFLLSGRVYLDLQLIW